MEIKNVIRDKKRTAMRTESMHIKISKKASKFMSENKISPTKVFHEALKELGFKE